MAETGTRRCPICWEGNPEWIAYGSCGHGEICSTCVARFRFITGNLKCYCCNIVLDVVFVTKASNDLDKYIDFPPNPKEGQEGEIWYHAGTKAFFDDYDEYQRIKTMCRICCTSCGEAKFMCVGELMSHLLEKHKLYMCLICLAWRYQLFVCEQKLFTTDQLNQHIRTGDSEVDGTYEERGGFRGHPYCKKCRNPFYGDEEIYVHFSTTSIYHYQVSKICCDCHICKWLHPVSCRTDNEVQAHFVKYHIREEEDAYWNANFPIIRAFFDDEDLEEHDGDVHYESARQERNVVNDDVHDDKDDVHDESTTIQVQNHVQNPHGSFRREPVYAYTQSPTVPPFYCPPLSVPQHGLIFPVQTQQHAEPSSYFRCEPVYAYTQSPIVPPFYCPPPSVPQYGLIFPVQTQQHAEPSSYSAQQQPYGEHTNQYLGRVEMTRTPLALGPAAASSLNITQSSLAQSRFPSSPFSVQQSYQDQSRSCQNSDTNSSSRVYQGERQAGFLSSSDYARFGMDGTPFALAVSSLNTTQSSSSPIISDTRNLSQGLIGAGSSYFDTLEGFVLSGLGYKVARNRPDTERPSSCPPIPVQQPYIDQSGFTQNSNIGTVASSSSSQAYRVQAQSSDSAAASSLKSTQSSSTPGISDTRRLGQDIVDAGSYLAPGFCTDSERQQELMDTRNASLNSSQAPVVVEHTSDSKGKEDTTG